jgi:YidC/Oxa1 family membrane protein insertase
MGWALILLTIVTRAVLIPVMLPSLKTMQKQRDLQPELKKIQEKYKHDKQKQAEEQMKFFREHGLNPTSGCLSQIVMLVVLFALYGVISKFTNGLDLAAINQQIYFDQFKFAVDSAINTTFFWLDLAKPDPVFAIPVLAGLFQLVSSKMMQPYVEKGEKLAEKTADKSDDLAYNMQEQMLYLMPIMTVVITFRLPSGIALYLLVTTIFSIAQQYFVSGWGGMRPLINKLKLWKN